MFAWWGRVVVRARWAVLAAAVALVVIGGTWGAGVFGELTGGGFDDPASETSRAAERITAELGRQGADVIVLWSSDTATVDQPAFRDPVTRTVAALRRHPEVTSVTTWYDTPAPALVATDRRATYALLRLAGADDDARTDAFETLRPALDAPGLRTEIGGTVAFLHQANTQTTEDITRAETLSMPVLLVLLVLIFGGLVAATTPLFGRRAGHPRRLRRGPLVTRVTDVSVFAVNVITLLGLGMAIDYALFMVSRFREELGAPANDTAAQAIRGPWPPPAGPCWSPGSPSPRDGQPADLPAGVPADRWGYGGMAAVLVAMLAALTVLPAPARGARPADRRGRVALPWRRHRPGGRRTTPHGALGRAWRAA